MSVKKENFFKSAICFCFLEFKTSSILIIRYPIGLLVGIIVLSLLFTGFLEMAIWVSDAPGAAHKTDPELLARFVLWSTLIGGFGSVGRDIEGRTTSGFMEIIWMSAFPPAFIFLVEAIVSMFVIILADLILAVVLMLIYSEISSFLWLILLAMIPTVVAAIGVGLIIGAATIVFKSIGQTESLLQMMLLPVFLGFGASGFSVTYVLPGFASLGLIVDGGRAGLSTILLAAAPATVWLALGVVAVTIAARISKSRALVYQY
ncbi:MAG: hypothetical protein V6Z86_09885 [Hyphomicrobiales bacterium]